MLTSNLKGISNNCKEDEIFEVAFTVNSIETFTKFYHDNEMDQELITQNDELGTLRSLTVRPPFPFLNFKLIDRSEYKHEDLLPNMSLDYSFLQKSNASVDYMNKNFGHVGLT